MLEEPLLQLGPVGPVLTVERHLLVVAGGLVAAAVSSLLGHAQLSRALLAGIAAFSVGVKSLIWILMNWK